MKPRKQDTIVDPAPDRPRLGTLDHPNLDRHGAQPHPRAGRIAPPRGVDRRFAERGR
jgi:hypothetical protein